MHNNVLTINSLIPRMCFCNIDSHCLWKCYQTLLTFFLISYSTLGCNLKLWLYFFCTAGKFLRNSYNIKDVNVQSGMIVFFVNPSSCQLHERTSYRSISLFLVSERERRWFDVTLRARRLQYPQRSSNFRSDHRISPRSDQPSPFRYKSIRLAVIQVRIYRTRYTDEC